MYGIIPPNDYICEKELTHMARLLIVTTKESALSRILAASFDVCRAVAPDDVTAEDLRSCDALALLGDRKSVV